MSIVAYIWGVVVLGGSLLLLALGAGAVARALFGDWRGPMGALARLALALCWVYLVAYVLGAMGWFRALPVFVAIDGGALLAWLALRRHRTGIDQPTAEGDTGRPRGTDGDTARPRGTGIDQPPADAGRRHSSAVVVGLSVVGAALAVGAWLPGTAHALRFGILEPDSLWYHGHFAVRFVQTGWLTRINPVGVDALVPFHLANREALDAILILPWHRDLALPFTNLAHLGLMLLAGWCVGARWNRGPAGMLTAALIASAPIMFLSHPGSLKNDLLATALLLAAIALFLHGDGQAAKVALAGATLGLAAGTKSNIAALVLATLVSGVMALLWPSWVRSTTSNGPDREPDDDDRDPSTAPPDAGPRWRGPAIWVGSTVAFGAYWYVRNWVRAGNPLPWIDIDLGPLHLSRIAPANPSEDYADQTLLAHIDDPRLISDVVSPGLRGAFGDLWWAWAGLLVASLALAVGPGRPGWLRAMVVTGILGLAAYLATPLSLVIPPDEPGAAFNFAFNTRYALPAVALLLMAGACAVRSRWAELAFAGALLALVIGGLRPTGLSSGVSHDAEASDTKVAIALGVPTALLAIWLLLLRPRLRGRWPGLGAAASVAGVVVALGAFPLVDRYLDRRYATPQAKLASELWPVTSQLEDARIGIATDPKPYPHAGTDLSNRVAYLGVGREGGVLRNAESCEEWGATVRALDLTHVALAPEPFATLDPGRDLEGWTLAIPGAEVVVRAPGQLLIQVPPDPLPTPREACRQR